MAKSLHVTHADISVSSTTTANTTQYWQIYSNMKKNNTEANVQMVMRTAGTLSHLHVYVYSNSISGGTSNLKIRKNGADTSLAVAVTASATGFFTDDTNTVSVAAGDKICLTTVPGAASGTMTFNFLSTIFTATDVTETVTRMATIPSPSNTNGLDLAAASGPYQPLGGIIIPGTPGLAETNIQLNQRYPGKFRNIAVKVRTNTRSTNSTITLRKNGTNTAVSVTVAAASTGWFENTTDVENVEVDDNVNYGIAFGAGSGDFTIDYFAIDYVSKLGYAQSVGSAANSAGDNIGVNNNFDYHLGGDGYSTVHTVSNIQEHISVGAEFQFSDVTIRTISNTVDSSSTLKVRLNNSDTSVSATIPANTSGVFTDSVNKVMSSATDLVNLRLSTGTGAGEIYVALISVYINDLTTTTGLVFAECDLTGTDVAGEFAVDFTSTDTVQRQTVWFSLSA